MNGGTIEQIKQAAPLTDFCMRVGLELNDRGFTRCVIHGEKTPSMMVRSDHFHCFGCGAYGDVIDLACGVWNCNKSMAIKELCRMYGINETADFRYSKFNSAMLMRKARERHAAEQKALKIEMLEQQLYKAAMMLDWINKVLKHPPDSPDEMTWEFAWCLSNKGYYDYMYDSADAELIRLSQRG